MYTAFETLIILLIYLIILLFKMFTHSFNPFSAGPSLYVRICRFYTSESDVCRHQILMHKDVPALIELKHLYWP